MFDNPRAYLVVDAAAVMIGLAVALAAWWFGLQPLYTAQADRKAEMKQLADTETAASDAADRLGELNNQIRQYEQALETDRVTLMSVDRLNMRLADLNSCAQESGLSVEAVQPGKAISGDRVDAVPITLIARCNYVQAATFMHDLTEALPDFGVVAFDLVYDARQPNVAATLEVSLHWYTQPAGHGKADPVRVATGQGGAER